MKDLKSRLRVLGVALIAGVVLVGGYLLYQNAALIASLPLFSSLPFIPESLRLTSLIPAGKVANTKGYVFAQNGNNKRLLKVGDTVFTGEHVVTGQHARLILKMVDSAVIALGEETEFKIQEYQYKEGENQGKGLVELISGFAQVASGKIAKLREAPYVMVTPVATMGVRGTKMWGRVFTDPDDHKVKLDVVCFDPSCVVTNDGGQQVITQADQSVSVHSQKQKPTNPRTPTLKILAQARIMVMVPRPLKPEQSQKLAEYQSREFIKQGVARNQAEAKELTNIVLESVIEEVEWRIAEDEIAQLAERRGKLSEEDIQEQLAKESNPELFESIYPGVVEKLVKELTAYKKLNQGKLNLDEVRNNVERLIDWESEWKGTTDLSTLEVTDDVDSAFGDEESGGASGSGKGAGGDEADGEQGGQEEDAVIGEVMDEASDMLKEWVDENNPSFEELLENAPDILDWGDEWKEEGGGGWGSGGEGGGGVDENGDGYADDGGESSPDDYVEDDYSSSEDVPDHDELDGDEVREDEPETDEGDSQDEEEVKDDTGEPDDTDSGETDGGEIDGGETDGGETDGGETDPGETDSSSGSTSSSSGGTTSSSSGGTTSSSSSSSSGGSDDNFKITDLELDTQSLIEGIAVGGVVSGIGVTTDPVGNTDYTITLKDDSDGHFAIADNQLVTAKEIDYEAATSHKLKFKVTADNGNTYNETITIQVRNIDLSSATVYENAALGTEVGEFSVSDTATGEVLTYALSVDERNWFGNSGSVGADLVVDGAIDYETDPQPGITVRVTDAAGITYDEPFTIEVLPVEGQPGDLALSGNWVIEHPPLNRPVGSLSATDGENSNPDTTLTFTLVDSAGGRFALQTSNGVTWLVVANQENIDYESASSHTVKVRVTDSDGEFSETSFTIQVRDITLAGDSVNERSATGTPIGEFAVTGVSSTLSYFFADSSDDAGGRFQVAGDELQVADGTLLNYETATSHAITIRVSDGSYTYYEPFVIQVLQVEHDPTPPVLSSDWVIEHPPLDRPVGSLTSTDAWNQNSDSTLTFTLVDDSNGRFKLVTANGVTRLVVANQEGIDYETATSHTVTVRVTDSDGDFSEATLTIQVRDITLSAATVAEQSATGTVIGEFAVSDVTDDSLGYFFADASDDAGGRFQVEGDTLKVDDGSLLNYDLATSHAIIIRVSDGTYTHYEPFTIQVTDVNFAPTALTLDPAWVIEGSLAGQAVGQLTALDFDQGDTLTFTLEDDGGVFALAVDPAAAVSDDQLVNSLLVVKAGAVIDYETATSHTVRIKVTDSGGLSYTQQVVVEVRNITLSDNWVMEGAATGVDVGVVAVSDPGGGAVSGENFSYDFPGNQYDDDYNGAFDINGSTLEVKDGTRIDYETDPNPQVTVQVVSGGNQYYEEFVLDVGNLGISDSVLPENPSTSCQIGKFETGGSEASFTYGLQSTDGGRFAVSGEYLVVAGGGELDYETGASREVVATFTSGADSYSEAVTIILEDIVLSANTIAEASANGTQIGRLSVVGGSDDYQFWFNDTSDSANGRFDITQDGQGNWWLVVGNGNMLDYETFPTHTITVRMGDGVCQYSEQFTINLTDVDDPIPPAPVLVPSQDWVIEGTLPGSVVVTLSLDNVLETEVFTLDISDDAGGLFILLDGDPNDEVIGDTLALSSGAVIDYETLTFYDLVFSYSSTFGRSGEFDLALEVRDVMLTGNDVIEGASAGIKIGVLGVSEPQSGEVEDEMLTFDFPVDATADDAGGRFGVELDGEWWLTVADGMLLDYESATYHYTTVRGSDGNVVFYEEFTIDLRDISLSNNWVGKDSTDDTPIGVLEVSGSGGEPFTFAVYDASDDHDVDASGQFAISDVTDDLLVATTPYNLLNAVDDSPYHTMIQVTDASGDTYFEPFDILVWDVDLSGDVVLEGLVNDRQVGQLSVVNAGSQGFGYEFEDTTDDAGGRFYVSNDEIFAVGSVPSLLDYETATSHMVNVRVYDPAGSSWFYQEFDIAVWDIRMTPDPAHALPFMTDGTRVAEFTINDASDDYTAGHAFSFDDSSDDAGGRFDITDDGVDGWRLLIENIELLVNDPLNDSYTILVHVVDASNDYYEEFTVRSDEYPLGCEDIPDSPTVGEMLGGSKATFRAFEALLAAANPGDRISVTEEEFERLVIGKANQQISSVDVIASLIGIDASDASDDVSDNVVRKFDIQFVAGAQPVVTVLMEIGVVDVIYNRLPAAVLGSVSTVGSIEYWFNELTPYASDYVACVKLVVYPEETGSGELTFSSGAISTVEVSHEGVPVWMNLGPYDIQDLINDYNNARDDLRDLGNNLKFFTGSSDLNDSQAIPTSQRFDYYFPGLVSDVEISDDAVVLIR